MPRKYNKYEVKEDVLFLYIEKNKTSFTYILDSNKEFLLQDRYWALRAHPYLLSSVVKRSGKLYTEYLVHRILNIPFGRNIRYLDGNPFNLQISNLFNPGFRGILKQFPDYYVVDIGGNEVFIDKEDIGVLYSNPCYVSNTGYPIAGATTLARKVVGIPDAKIRHLISPLDCRKKNLKF